MIEIDRTDEEREELVKQWIRDYWAVAVGAVVLAIALVYGLNYFRQSKIDALSKTAAEVEQVGNDIAGNKIDAAKKAVEAIQNDQTKTSFSTVATLELAKKLFDDGKFDEASQQYAWIVANSGEVAMRDIGRLRKARAESNAKKFADAINTLDSLETQDYSIEANLLKGDILLANKQFDEAKKVYENLQAADGELNPEVTQRRLDLLSIKQQKAQ